MTRRFQARTSRGFLLAVVLANLGVALVAFAGVARLGPLYLVLGAAASYFAGMAAWGCWNHGRPVLEVGDRFIAYGSILSRSRVRLDTTST